MMDEVHVLALSKTGDRGFPIDQVVEVAVFRVDMERCLMESVFDAVVRQDTAMWSDEVKAHVESKHGITVEEVENGRDEGVVAEDLRTLVQYKVITSFDVRGDFIGHLMNEPWDLGKEAEVCSSVSVRASHVYRSNDRGVDALRDTYLALLPDDPAMTGDEHSAYDDAARCAALVIELHQRGLF